MVEGDPFQQGKGAALDGKKVEDCPYVFNQDARWYAWMQGWYSVHRSELQRKWEITARHLETAYGELPASLPVFEDGRSVERYKDFLSHNELGLAFDELEGIGAEIGCSQRFWAEMLAAAENMGLTEHEDRCRKRLTSP